MRARAFLLAAGLLCGAAPLGAQGIEWNAPSGGATADPLSLANITGTTSNCGGAAAAAANSVCLTSGGIDAEGTTADAFEFRLAFGDSTADQTLTCTGAASSLGCVVNSPAAPANGTTAGNALALTASPAIPNAGAGTDGAAAGGPVTITTGAAARDTSGNANGGNLNVILGAGIGTGTAGQILIPNGTAAAPVLSFTTATNAGIYHSAGLEFSAGGAYQAGVFAGGLHIGSSGQLWLGAATSDTNAGLTRVANGLIRFTDGSTGLGWAGFGVNVETVATTKAPAIIESAELYTNGADTDGQAITLPNDPTVGTCFEFYLTATNSSGTFSIAPGAGETIRAAGSSCGTSYTATAIGNSARLCAVSGGSGAVWGVMSFVGTWTCNA